MRAAYSYHSWTNWCLISGPTLLSIYQSPSWFNLWLLSNGLQYVGQRDTQLIQVHILHPSLHSKQLAYSTAHVHQSQSKVWILLHQSLLYYFPVYHLDLGVRVGIGGTHYKNRLTKNPHKVSLLDYILGIQCQVSNQYKSSVYMKVCVCYCSNYQS